MAEEKNTSAQKNVKQQPKTTLKRTQVKHHPLKTTYNFASEVKKHSKTQYTQNFSSYTDIYGAEDLDYDLIDGLYHSTILNRVIRKISADAVPEMFKIQVVDLEGNRIPDIEQACFAYTANLKRTHIKSYFTQTLKYGTGFLYIGNKEEDQLTNMFLLHPKDLKPVMDEGFEIDEIVETGETDLKCNRYPKLYWPIYDYDPTRENVMIEKDMDYFPGIVEIKNSFYCA